MATTKIQYYNKKTGNYSLRYKNKRTGRMAGLHIDNKFKGNHIKNINRMMALYRSRGETTGAYGDVYERLKKMKKGKFTVLKRTITTKKDIERHKKSLQKVKRRRLIDKRKKRKPQTRRKKNSGLATALKNMSLS